MVHQHFMLAENYSLQKILFWARPKAGGVPSKVSLREGVLRLLRNTGFDVTLTPRLKTFRWRRSSVEILKALYRGAEILILMSLRQFLTPQETRSHPDHA